MKPATGTLSASRARLAAVLRAARESVSVGGASQALGIERHRAAQLLSAWTSQGLAAARRPWALCSRAA